MWWFPVCAALALLALLALSDQRSRRRSSYARRVHRAEVGADAEATLTVRLVVPAGGRADAWSETLFSLFHTARRPARIRVVVVADASQLGILDQCAMRFRQHDEIVWCHRREHVDLREVPAAVTTVVRPDRLRRLVHALRVEAPARVHVVVAPLDPIVLVDGWDETLDHQITDSVPRLTEMARSDGAPSFMRVVREKDPMQLLPVLGSEPLVRPGHPVPTAFWCPDFYAARDDPIALLHRLPNPDDAPPLSWAWVATFRVGADLALFQPGTPLLTRRSTRHADAAAAERTARRRTKARLTVERELYLEVRRRVRALRARMWRTTRLFEARGGMRCAPAASETEMPRTELYGQAFLGVVDASDLREVQAKYGSQGAFERALRDATGGAE